MRIEQDNCRKSRVCVFSCEKVEYLLVGGIVYQKGKILNDAGMKGGQLQKQRARDLVDKGSSRPQVAASTLLPLYPE